AALDRYRHDLILELAGLLRRLGLVLRGDGERVLLRPRDLPLAGDVLRGITHVIAVKGLPQAVLDHRIDHLEVAHLHAAAQIRAVRGNAHRFLAAGDRDLGIAVEDALIAKRDRAQSRAAKLVDAPGRDLDRDSRIDRGLTGRALALAGLQNLPQDHFGDARGLNAGAIDRRLDRDFAEFVGRHRAECPIECADRSAYRADNDNVVLHGRSFQVMDLLIAGLPQLH